MIVKLEMILSTAQLEMVISTAQQNILANLSQRLMGELIIVQCLRRPPVKDLKVREHIFVQVVT